MCLALVFPLLWKTAHPKVREAYNSDTSRSFDHMPYYPWNSLDEMRLPKGCALVGVELTDDAVELPRFQHPQAAAYVLGRERAARFRRNCWRAASTW